LDSSEERKTDSHHLLQKNSDCEGSRFLLSVAGVKSFSNVWILILIFLSKELHCLLSGFLLDSIFSLIIHYFQLRWWFIYLILAIEVSYHNLLEWYSFFIRRTVTAIDGFVMDFIIMFKQFYLIIINYLNKGIIIIIIISFIFIQK
jgi:hypothetical protein